MVLLAIFSASGFNIDPNLIYAKAVRLLFSPPSVTIIIVLKSSLFSSSSSSPHSCHHCSTLLSLLIPKPRRLLRQEITYSVAQKEEVNILHRLGYYDQQMQFFAQICHNRSWIKAIVAHHLNLTSPDACDVDDPRDWLHGSFNLCIPVTVRDWSKRQQSGRRVLLRIPLPYRVGDAFQPGNGDEKVRCEAGTYAWLQANCPDAPIPRLYGFAVSTGETVSVVSTHSN